MSRFDTTVRVVANPYHRLDHKGRPCCAVPVEPTEFGGHLGYIGASIDAARTKKPKKAVGSLYEPRQDTVFAFSSDPVKVEATRYYRDELRNGALLPADEKTAKFAGVKFRPIAEALAATKKSSEEHFEREYGEGSLEALGLREAPAETAPAAAPEPSPEKPSAESSSRSNKGGKGRGKGDS